MPAEETSEFEAGIAGRAEKRGFKFGRHQIFVKPNRFTRFLIFVVEAYLSIIMHKYSSILTGLAELSSRNQNLSKPGVFQRCRTGQAPFCANAFSKAFLMPARRNFNWTQ
jgi:hypothetical protein